VAVETFERYLGRLGYNEIANHLNRPGGRAPPVHVDSTRNTARKWSKTTIPAIRENPVYTGRPYWNRLDFRAVNRAIGRSCAVTASTGSRPNTGHEGADPRRLV
jgi:hypothetical protein